jgi:hypothetical protein
VRVVVAVEVRETVVEEVGVRVIRPVKLAVELVVPDFDSLCDLLPVGEELPERD